MEKVYHPGEENNGCIPEVCRSAAACIGGGTRLAAGRNASAMLFVSAAG